MVAGGDHTDKVRWGRQQGLHVVSPLWVHESGEPCTSAQAVVRLRASALCAMIRRRSMSAMTLRLLQHLHLLGGAADVVDAVLHGHGQNTMLEASGAAAARR